MPYIYVKLAFGEAPPLPERRINPLTPGMAWVRGMDCEPTLVPMHEIEAYELTLQRRLKNIDSKG
jgi:hypothetical protein